MMRLKSEDNEFPINFDCESVSIRLPNNERLIQFMNEVALTENENIPCWKVKKKSMALLYLVEVTTKAPVSW